MTESAPLFMPRIMPRTNPFATRFTRPGVLVPLDDDGDPLDLDALLDRLAIMGGSGSLEGPHGRGKTTTLLALAHRACHRGVVVGVQRVRSVGDVRKVCRTLSRMPPGGMLFIDGWESLGWFSCRLIRFLTGLRACHLVVTSHGPSGLPLLKRCGSSSQLLARILLHLPDTGPVIDERDVGEAFARHGGNLRESLYDLYDRFERRSRS